MMTRNVGATVVGGVVAIAAGIASCSFPTYNITVTGSGGATASSGSVGGGGGASASNGSVGGGGSASASNGSAGGGGSATTSTSSGPCATDEDGDQAISWQCAGGTDCADQDPRAYPKADFTAGAPIMGPRSPVTLPYDFNCDKIETRKTVKLNCPIVCVFPGKEHGFQIDVDCGKSGTLGHCQGGVPCKWTSDSADTLQICK
jgi:hypothetical protein